MHMRQALTFDDVQLIPKFSDIESRSECNLTAQFTRHYRINIPIVAAPMDTVCEFQMAFALHNLGGVGCIHRFMDIKRQCSELVSLYGATQWKSEKVIATAAVGAMGDYQERTERLIDAGVNVILIDVAHGDHIHVKRAMEWMNKLSTRSQFDIIAGNIATSDAALRLCDWGADALRVGIGGGSMCTTRVNTGVGIPQLDAIKNVCYALEDFDYDVPVISDGGIRYPGDAAKALGMGANTVMLGGMLAGTNEAPGDVITTGNWPYEKRMKLFRGSASASAKRDVNGVVKHVEGASRLVDAKGPLYEVVDHITDGIRSAMSYVGARTLGEFRARADFVQITTAGQVEAHPHGMR